MSETPNETPVLDLLARMTADSIDAANLDVETLMLVRIAALVAVGAAPVSYAMNLEIAGEIALDPEKLRGVFMAIAPIVGTARVAAATGNIVKALAVELAGNTLFAWTVAVLVFLAAFSFLPRQFHVGVIGSEELPAVELAHVVEDVFVDRLVAEEHLEVAGLEALEIGAGLDGRAVLRDEIKNFLLAVLHARDVVGERRGFARLGE